MPALADDSGVCVDALDGAPGVLSARYAGEPRSDARNNAKLLQALAGVADRRAHYYCVLVLVRHAGDPEPMIAEGRWHGRVIDVARGDGGFGYDPHFEDAANGPDRRRAAARAEERDLASRTGDARADRAPAATAMRRRRHRSLTRVAAFRALPPLSLYVHIPWCIRKCPYCDFNSHEAHGDVAETPTSTR